MKRQKLQKTISLVKILLRMISIPTKKIANPNITKKLKGGVKRVLMSFFHIRHSMDILCSHNEVMFGIIKRFNQIMIPSLL